MHWAARWGQWGALEALAAGGADVDPVDDEGNTPLHDAASRGHLLAVGVLTGLGASTSKKNKGGKTPQDLLGKPSADELFSMAKKCAAAEKERMRKMQDKLEEQQKEMKKRYDSKEAEADTLQKENGELKKELQEKEKENKVTQVHDKLEEQARKMKKRYDSKEAEEKLEEQGKEMSK
ncbi:ankyrin repeat and SAM domain-containing protein 4B-like, partial [Penaeus indicus]|uniref:ankyrin repeat and SAM domain-containing protein 4B-like n=1 Tax=Penaeus indicus TaxID=29960 RepID=UPI00300D2230